MILTCPLEAVTPVVTSSQPIHQFPFVCDINIPTCDSHMPTQGDWPEAVTPAVTSSKPIHQFSFVCDINITTYNSHMPTEGDWQEAVAPAVTSSANSSATTSLQHQLTHLQFSHAHSGELASGDDNCQFYLENVYSLFLSFGCDITYHKSRIPTQRDRPVTITAAIRTSRPIHQFPLAVVPTTPSYPLDIIGQ